MDESFEDSLYIMGFSSPPILEKQSSPPRPTTPIRQPRITIGPLLRDISKYEKHSGGKLVLNSPRVVLNRAREESVVKSLLKRDHESSSRITNAQSKERQNNTGSQARSKSPCSDNVAQLKTRLSESSIETDAEENSVDNGALESNQPHQACDIEHVIQQLAPMSSVAQDLNHSTVGDSDITAGEKQMESDESTLIDIDTLCEQLETSSDTITEEQSGKLFTSLSSKEVGELNVPDSSKSISDVESSALPASEESARFSFGDDEAEDRKETDSFISFKNSTIYVPDNDPPSYSDALFSMGIHGIFPVDNGTPFWGDVNDAGTLNKEGRGKDAQISNKLISSLPVFSKLLLEV